MEFRILGPLEVLAGGEPVDIGGPRREIVLASLLLDAGRVVPVTRLTDAIYGDDVPSTARVQTQICISMLRRLLAAHGRPDAIATRSGGYALQVQPGVLDLDLHDESLAAARRSRDAHRLREAVRHYRAALSLWRGSTLEEIGSRMVRAAAGHLDERRMAVWEECIELELQIGGDRDLVAELTGLVMRYPLRERLRGQLMLALYRSDRQAEALEVYRSGRRTMIDELGLEPNSWLRELEYGILNSDVTLRVPRSAPPGPDPVVVRPPAPSARPPALKMLPTDIGDFTGRAGYVHAVEQTFRGHPGRTAVPVVVVVGKPGVGKTTLAVHVAHQLAAEYPDGQFFADLHGRAAGRADPADVLERFLYVLGVPYSAIPQGPGERSELYRGLLSRRRTLILLDNVEDESQVMPLLPGDPGSVVLVTSQTRLSGIPGAVHIELEVFDPDQSLELLARIVGRERIGAEPEAAAALAGLCGQLPLALRIAGARLSSRPKWWIAHLVDRLQDEVSRLDELRHGGMEIRASLSLSYRSVDPAAQRLFRLLGALDFPAFSGWVAVTLLDVPAREAQELLDGLADAQLVETTGTGLGVHSRYRFQDLIRVFARECLAQESPEEREVALKRVLGALSYLSAAAHRRVNGRDRLQLAPAAGRWPLPEHLVEQLVDAPLEWFEQERASIVAGVRQAALAGLDDICWDLALHSVTIFVTSTQLDDWRETHRFGLAAARRAGNQPAAAALLYSVGLVAMLDQRFADARQELADAAALFRAGGDQHGESHAMGELVSADPIEGDLDAAERRYERALRAARRAGDPARTAHVLHDMARVQVQVDGAYTERAMATLDEALELSRRGGSRRLEAQVLHRIGLIHLAQGRPGDAVACFNGVLGAVRELGDPIGEAYALHGLDQRR
ncbi:AfsR/SARP family transcriptional regulator [Winogradskya humida]|uniref:SARP family transcriptional regulator n=1 Tax=Winogradskya humida TaxID=113566 RepID=A0ABQ4A4T6_9ACTN|nr:BTAD domain-containing putative transcriptional regulator [Actinoplanes humidus]GIE25855.1 SARP family transcriptional regulator [Actinoplanes humidus]